MKLNQFKLKRLIVSKTYIEASSLEILAEVIKHPNFKFELLSINENNLNNYGGLALLNNFKCTTSIRELYMYRCCLNDNHFELIKQLIIYNKIEWISIYRNRPKTFLELLALSQVIKTNKQVEKYDAQCFQYFDIRYNKLSTFNGKDIEMLLSII